jgi:hypothetical protein
MDGERENLQRDRAVRARLSEIGAAAAGKVF